MKAFHLFSLLIVGGLTISFSLFNGEAETQSDRPVEIVQSGMRHIVTKESSTLGLESAPFSIQFYVKEYDLENKKFHAGQIAALESEDALQDIKIGMSTDDTSCFAGGSGLAGNRDGYSEMFITNSGHHYLFYQQDQESRVKLIEKTGDLYKVEFEILGLYRDGKSIDFSDFSGESLYLAILVVANLNKIIDKGELTKVKILMN